MSSPSGSTISLPDSNVLLAIPDGPIAPDSVDAKSPLVSLIGGYPTFPPLPSVSKAPETIRCGICHHPIPLLAQVYCPPEGGENDRTVYVWACPRPTCQRREGSIRAFRASVRNEEYAQDAEEKRLAAEKAAEEEKARARKNPFSVSLPLHCSFQLRLTIRCLILLRLHYSAQTSLYSALLFQIHSQTRPSLQTCPSCP